MNLHNFEEYFDDVILNRGKDYIDQGHIEKIEEMAKNRYIVEVLGSEIYTVDVLLSDAGEIVDTYCDCPYDWGDYCKHQAAAFFALRSKTIEKMDKSKATKSSEPQKKVHIKTILSSLSKEELMKIILQFSAEYPTIEQKILFNYSTSEDEIIQSKKLIKEFINQAMHRGFIPWDKTFDAVRGADMTLEKAQRKLEDGEVESAVFLCITVLSIVVDMLQYCDDSSGYVGIIIDESLEMIDEAVSKGVKALSVSQQDKLFAAIMKEAFNDRYEGWSNWRLSLLEACVHFSGNTKLRKKLETQLEILEKGTADSWMSKYEIQHIKRLKL
ncbi:SWIM zinc finger family protein [Bacillus sp. FJAT-47783]|uniref:SWIM zinc finger family protein n=1 Tax=Bacillus sp. FJAT-47783 TaxID=2922712 RepID=UPI001FACCCFD|nr:SWIM zinc finger family protein [Bacillus sp. FJAT-47783]